MRRLVLTTLLVLGFVGPALAATAATPEPRVALVIGNSAYRETPLANPVNDARLMAETLRGLGLPYLYLGYWIADCRKMAYKTRFQPVEVLGPGGWRRFDEADEGDAGERR